MKSAAANVGAALLCPHSTHPLSYTLRFLTHSQLHVAISAAISNRCSKVQPVQQGATSAQSAIGTHCESVSMFSQQFAK